MRKFLVSILTVFGLSSVQASDLSANSEMNQSTIQALLDAGSSSSKPHPLEHHFYCYSLESLNALVAKGEKLGYRAANDGDNEHEGTHYWYVDLIKDTVLDLNVINKVNSVMLELASEFNADYDGWGTPVVE